MSAKLDDVISAYLAALESGAAPSRAELLARHPDLSQQLTEFFASRDVAAPPAPVSTDQAASATPEAEATKKIGGPGQASTCRDAAESGEDQFATHSLAQGVPLESSGLPGSVSGLSPRFGDYELLEELGRGAMGVVYKARQISLNRIVAIKMILGGQFASEEQVRRFYVEAEAAAHLEHPGIVPIYEVGQRDGQRYYSMGFVAGQSLAARLAAGPVSPAQAARWVRGIAEAIAYAHGRSVIHRDLKPANILLTVDGVPRVADFGLAKRTNVDSAHTHTGTVLGTPCYMAPEQAEGKSQDIGPAADIYSLGAVLYELLTGVPPFRAEQMHETLRQVREDEPRPPRQINPRVPRELETICLMCLAKAPRDRYASAQQLAEDLDCFLAEQPLKVAHRASWPARLLRTTTRAVRRRPLRATYVVLSGLALAFVATMTILAYFEKRGEFDRVLGQAQAAERDAQRQGRKFTALERYANARDQYAALLAANDGSRDLGGVRLSLADVYIQRGIILVASRDLDSASEEFVRARDMLQAVREGHPRWADRQLKLAEVYHNLGITEDARQTTAALHRSLEFYEQSRAVRAELLEQEPENRAYRRDLARSYGYMGDTQLVLGETAGAWDSYEQARRLRQDLVDEQGDDLAARFQLGRSKANTAHYWEWLGKSNDALAAYRDRLAYLSDLPIANPPAGFEADGANGCMDVARIEIDLLKTVDDEPERLLQRALQMFLHLQQGDQRERTLVSLVAKARVNLGKYYLRTDNTQNAEQEIRQAVQLLDDPQSRRLVVADDEYYLAASYALLSQLPTLAGDRLKNEATALSHLERAVNDGYQNKAFLEHDLSFRSFRDLPDYRQIVQKIDRARVTSPKRSFDRRLSPVP